MFDLLHVTSTIGRLPPLSSVSSQPATRIQDSGIPGSFELHEHSIQFNTLLYYCQPLTGCFHLEGVIRISLTTFPAWVTGIEPATGGFGDHCST